LNTYFGITTLSSALFLLFCIPINVVILWAYRRRSKAAHPAAVVAQNGTMTMAHQNAAAKAKADQLAWRLMLYAVITFFAHALITLNFVSQNNFYASKKNKL
jgi:hypothetical protein